MNTAPARATSPVSRPRRPRTIRTHLVILVLGTLLPLLIFTAIVLAMNVRLQERAIEDRLIDTVRALAVAADRELRAAEAALQVLATSPTLDRRDLRSFYDKAIEVGDLHGGWIVLVDRTGRQLLNTSRPFGAALPPTVDAAIADEDFRTPKPQVTELFMGSSARRSVMAESVPIVQRGSVVQLLYMAFPPGRFAELLAGQRLPPGRTL